MIVNRLKGNSPSLLFLLVVLAVAFRFPYQAGSFGPQTPFSGWLLQVFSENLMLSVLSTSALLLLQAFYINRLNFKYIFLEGQSYLPSLIFVIFWGVWFDFSGFHPVLMAHLFLLASIDKFYIITKDPFVPANYFEGMFFLSAGSLFYPMLVLYFPLFLVIQLLFRTFNWREWMTGFFGFVLPFLMLVLVCFIFELPLKLKDFLVPIRFENPQIRYSVFLWAAAPIAIMVLWGLGYLFSVLGIRKISTRKYYNAFFLHLIFGVVVYLIWFSTNHDFLMLLGFPVSMVLAIWITGMRSKFWADMAFVLFCVCVVLLRYASQMV